MSIVESSASQIVELPTTPSCIEKVVPETLEPAFHQECSRNLTQLRDICANPKAGSVSFFVGAGISKPPPAGLPLATEIIKKLYQYAAEFCPEIGVYVPILTQALNDELGVTFENTFQHLYEIVHPRTFHSIRLYDVPTTPPRFNSCHQFLAGWLGDGRGCVLTTNLDPLIEHAWRYLYPQSGELEVKKRPQEFEGWQQRLAQPGVVWKLHGSADDPQSWAVTLGTVGFALSDARADLLDHVMQHTPVCFVGWRAADVDIVPCVRKGLRASAADLPPIFWVFYYREQCRTLDDYLAVEPFAAQLFKQSMRPICPIVTTAERMFAWLSAEVLGSPALLPDKPVSSAIDYNWLKLDLYTAHEFGIHKLVGVLLRSAGQYTSSSDVLDAAAQKTIIRASQLLQDSAQDYWQRKEVREALTRIERAHRLLSMGEDEMSLAWCQYGHLSMALSAVEGVGLIEKIQALVQLQALRRQFARLDRTIQGSTSPKLGIGLCIQLEARMLERVLAFLRLLTTLPARRLLLVRYRLSAKFVKAAEHAPPLIPLKKKIAFLLAPDDPRLAIDEMSEALQLARVVGQPYYVVTLDAAADLARQLGESDFLASALDEKRRLQATT